jgi:arylsulfatase A-like enzyme/Flp pilus assembly protein TadD
MKKKIFFFSFFTLFIAFLTTIRPFSFSQSKPKLNLLLITIDTLRADRVSCYNSEHVKTPNIDRLAEKGITFTRAFAHTPLTLPSHTNILLGTTPLYHGVHDNISFNVKENFLTLAELLKEHGYSTGAFVGASPLDSRFGLDQGFDIYDDNFIPVGAPKLTSGERKGEIVVNEALKWLEEQQDLWFLWVHLYDPHYPYEPPEPFLTQYGDKAYDGEAAYVDFILGKLFQYVRVNKLFEKTVVIFTSDHGESLGEHGEPTHGTYAYNSTLWIPLIIAAPEIKPNRVNQFVSHIDIFPTVCEAFEIESPSFLQGISLFPLMREEKWPVRLLYFESLGPYYNFGYAPLRGYINEKEKFIDSPIPELYELSLDFGENNNLANDKNLGKYRENLNEIIERDSNPNKINARNKLDKNTLEKLRSLGYIGNPVTPKKEIFTEEDDAKILFPLYDKAVTAYKLREKGEIDKGISHLKQFILEEKRIDFAYSFLAKLYKEKGNNEEALRTLQEGLEQHPLSYEILSLYVEYLMELDQYDRIISILNSRYSAQMEQDPELWNILGQSYIKKGNIEDSVEAFEKAISIDNEYVDALFNLGSIYLSLSIKTKGQDELKKALQNLKRAIEIDPGFAKTYNSLGAAYLQAGDLDNAINSWEKTIQLSSEFEKANYYLGLLYLSKGKKDKALPFLEKYKTKFYKSLSLEEQKKLDSLILKAREK